MHKQLAILGGTRSVTLEIDDSWPVISDEAVRTVAELLRSGCISIGDGSGPIGEFEDNFAEYTGAKHVLMHNNGTAALHAGFYAVGVGPGDEVIVPSYTWHATAGAVVAVNAVPVFCESDPRTLTLDPDDVRRRISSSTKCIAVVHLWGNVANMDEIMQIARDHNLVIVEDCSHSHGASWRGQQVGTIGDVGCFSLQGSKVLPAGEGGVLVTNNPRYYDRALLLGSHGRIQKDALFDESREYTTGFGFKYRPHPVAAAIAVQQLEQLDEHNASRKDNYEHLMDGLLEIPAIDVTETLPQAKRGGYYGTRVLCSSEQLMGVPTEVVIRALQAEGVACSEERYPLLHLTSYYRDCQKAYEGFCAPAVSHKTRSTAYRCGDLPVTEGFHRNIIAVPTFTNPQLDLIEQYIEAFGKVMYSLDTLRQWCGSGS
jgi:dTDP-4-amino-4,6-dideoxygalactose transaminase